MVVKQLFKLFAVSLPLFGMTEQVLGQHQSFSITQDKQGHKIDIRINGMPFTSYLYPDSLMKPVLYPIITSKGDTVTRGWPLIPRAGDHIDHPHHIGLWFTYENVNGLDFWNNSSSVPASKKQQYGSIRHYSVDTMWADQHKAMLRTTAFWLKPDAAKLLKQQTTYLFSGKGNMRSITLTVRLTALGEEVVFKDTKDGLIGLRVRTELEQPSGTPEKYIDNSGKTATLKMANKGRATGHYLSSEGLKGDAVWSSRGKWVALYAKLNHKPVSVVILDHPQNVGYPTYWHARGYGLFAANPFGQGVFGKGLAPLDFRLKPGESVLFKYKVLIQEGKRYTVSEINKAAAAFAGR